MEKAIKLIITEEASEFSQESNATAGYEFGSVLFCTQAV